jgi:hypothetical protein
MPRQFVPSPKNPRPRRGGSRVPRTGRREDSGPLSDPRQMAVRAVYTTPPRTSSAPSPIRNMLASQFIAVPFRSQNRGIACARKRTFGMAGHVAVRRQRTWIKPTRESVVLGTIRPRSPDYRLVSISRCCCFRLRPSPPPAPWCDMRSGIFESGNHPNSGEETGLNFCTKSFYYL